MGRMTEAERVRYAQENRAEREAREGYALWRLRGHHFLGGFILGLVAATVLATVLHTFLGVPL